MRHLAFSMTPPSTKRGSSVTLNVRSPFHQTKKQFVRNRIEVGLQVNVHHERIAIVDALHDRAQPPFAVSSSGGIRMSRAENRPRQSSITNSKPAIRGPLGPLGCPTGDLVGCSGVEYVNRTFVRGPIFCPAHSDPPEEETRMALSTIVQSVNDGYSFVVDVELEVLLRYDFARTAS